MTTEDGQGVRHWFDSLAHVFENLDPLKTLDENLGSNSSLEKDYAKEDISELFEWYVLQNKKQIKLLKGNTHA